MKRDLFLFPIFLFAVVLAGVLFAFPAAGATVNAPGVILSADGKTPDAVPGGVAVLSEDAPLAVSGDAEKAERSEDGATVAVVLTGDGTRTKRKATVSVTEDELYDIIENMTDEGSISEERGELVSSALEFADIPVESVLTARVDVAAIDVDDEPEEILATIRAQRHSRIPVYEGSIDHVIGVLQIRKYIRACVAANGPVQDIRPLLDETMFVHHSKTLDDLLPEMSRRKVNLAVVTDNYGGMLGIVTVEDILEELVGEIWDEEDTVEEPCVHLPDGALDVDAEMTVGEVFDELDYEDPEDDEDLQYKLLSEWTYEQFPDMPQPGREFAYHDITVRVTAMQDHRILRLLVKCAPAEGGDEA